MQITARGESPSGTSYELGSTRPRVISREVAFRLRDHPGQRIVRFKRYRTAEFRFSVFWIEFADGGRLVFHTYQNGGGR